jgi:hypothetical protein
MKTTDLPRREGSSPAHCSAFRDDLHALINQHASQIGPEAAAYWLSTMAHSALAHLVWMPGETKQAYEHLGKVCDLLPMPNVQAQRTGDA